MGMSARLPGNNQCWGLAVRHHWRKISSSRTESMTYRSYVPEKVMCRKSPCLPGDANCCGMPAVSRVYGTAHNYEGPSGGEDAFDISPKEDPMLESYFKLDHTLQRLRAEPTGRYMDDFAK